VTQSNNRQIKSKPPKFEPVAIIGIGAMFPKANDTHSYWANIKGGVDAIDNIPETHWRPEDYFDADPKRPDFTYAQRGGFLDVQDFDPLEFGMPPNVLEATDTSQLLGMLVAARALRDAGYGEDKNFDRNKISTIVGVTGALELVTTLSSRLGHPRWKQALRDSGVDEKTANDVMTRIGESYVSWQENSFPGLLGNVVAGRISKHLNLGGTNCVVDAACASSLSAMHLGIMELQTHRADMIVTGGVDTFNDIFMYMCFSKTPALSPTGNASPFSANGDGTILGEGLGVVVLKRLKDATRDGDKIYGVIKSIGTSSDGRGGAVYEPSTSGQVKALACAYKESGIDPRTIELVEAHGTGTKVGDGVEVSALAQVYPKTNKGPWCALGSVKSQIGHAKAAAGVAGFIKAALSLYNKVLPPTIKCNEPLEILKEKSTPFYVNQSMRPWLGNSDHPRRAAVSAFGFGGSNFHCVLEEYETTKLVPDWNDDVEIAAFSGDTILMLGDKVTDVLKCNHFREVSIVTHRERALFNVKAKYRLVLVIDRFTDYKNLCNKVLSKLNSTDGKNQWQLPEGVYFYSSIFSGKVAMVFPGQGAQYIDMLQDMACLFPEMLESLTLAGKSVCDTIYPVARYHEGANEKQMALLSAMQNTQVAIGAVSAGAFKVLSSFGIKADVFAGHSYGELVALFAAGRITEEALYEASVLRGALMAKASKSGIGAMSAVKATAQVVQQVCLDDNLDVIIANYNMPEQMVISGDNDSIAQAERSFKARNISTTRLNVSGAFHSRFVADAVTPFLAGLNEIKFIKSGAAVYANTTARIYPQGGKAARQLLANQIAKPVLFVNQIEQMVQDGVTLFIEVGPNRKVAGMVKRIVASHAPVQVVSLDASGGKKNGIVDLAKLLAQISAFGIEVDLTCWNACGEQRREVQGMRKAKMVVPISGANYVSPKEKRPPVKQNRVPQSSRVIAAETKSVHDAASVTVLPQTIKPVTHNPLPQTNQIAEMQPPVAASGVGLQHLQQSLAALSQMQQQTANLHTQFLVSQQTAAQNMQQLMMQQTQLVSGTIMAPVNHMPTEIQKPVGPSAPEVPSIKATPVAQPVVLPESVQPLAPKPATTGNHDYVGSVLLEIISDKTGYPQEMLALDMALDSDLGIDSIKRVEILSALQEALPESPKIESQHLGTIDTLGKIVDHMASGAVNQIADTATHASQKASEPQHDQITQILLEIISDKTGYPVDMLALDMTLDADLGIDSIKRVEILSAVQEALPESPAIESEHLGSIHSLHDIVAHLTDGNVVAPLSDVNKSKFASEIITSTVTSSSVESNEITTVLLATIADKTGYPADMLEMDMTLDSDLGIDSIKRVEILSAIQDALPESTVIESTHLGQLHTLADIAGHLAGGNSGRTTIETIPVVENCTEPVCCPEKTIERMVLRSVPIKRQHRTIINIQKDRLCLIANDRNGIGKALCELLVQQGYQIALIDRTKLSLVPENIGTLIVVGDDKMSDGDLLQSFELIQQLGTTLQDARGALITVSRLDGAFGLAASAENSISGALNGITKTAQFEWPNVYCQAIDLNNQFTTTEDVIAQLHQAIFFGGPIEIGVSKKGLTALTLVSESVDVKAQSIPVAPGEVIVVSGGGRGVTARVACELAKAFKPTLVLVGRSQLSETMPAWLDGLSSDSEIKAAIAKNSATPLTPKSLTAQFNQIMSEKEIKANIAVMEAYGASVVYKSVDIRDSESVASILNDVRNQYGAISGLVHGAGVLADRFIVDKTIEQFDKVYGTKVDGMNHLLNGTTEDDLKIMVFFSSSTGRFGRKGQVDYAVANEVLNKRAGWEKQARPNCTVVSVNWGPWDGGMVNDALKDVFAAEGIEVIDLDAGAAYLVDELCCVNDTPSEVVILGAPLPKSSVPFELDAIVTKTNIITDNFKETIIDDNIVTNTASLTPVFNFDVSVDTVPCLTSHVINGKAVVPAALMMEWLSQGAMQHHVGLQYVGIDNFKVLRGILLTATESKTVSISVGALVATDEGFKTEVVLHDDQQHVYVSGEVILSNQRLKNESFPIILNGLTRYGVSEEEIYNGLLFHGKDFGLLTNVQSCNHQISATLPSAPDANVWLQKPLRKKWLSDPLAIDGAFQLMILWTLENYKAHSLPSGLSQYRQFVRHFPKEGVKIAIEVTDHSAGKAVATIAFLNVQTNEVVAHIEGYLSTIDASLKDPFSRNQLTAHKTKTLKVNQ
jgi:acyl transferase domain-containing protein/NAD(P)-dependent dehydrogenase (short-subunit alcohol dehydrogenase family)/acyl carrier protein